MRVEMGVTGRPRSDEVEARLLLVHYLREVCGLRATNVGCDTTSCGSCTVHMNGKAVKSCSMVAMQAEGANIVTIEGIAAPDGTLHPMQAAFKENHGLQCGFCTPGMVLTAVGLAAQNRNPTEAQIREALDGNFCRCTGYHNIVKAVKSGIEEMA
ncbi:MAG TPA: (2Fe-2S)-binding protein [Usitatibacter sp.]|nr:(2Fe-2S)-binding protein [Usitatibacter sp.]